MYFCFYFESLLRCRFSFLFFFNDTATTEIYTLSLHDALPIFERTLVLSAHPDGIDQTDFMGAFNARLARFLCMNLTFHTSNLATLDRKSTRLNSSHT